jgi:uncharacterized membrane protein
MERWVNFALLAVLLSVMNNFIIGKLLREGLQTHETIIFALPFYLMFVLSLYLGKKNELRTIKSSHLGLLALSTLIGSMTLFFYRTAVTHSPNPGYVGAMLALNTIPITILSFMFLGGKFTILKFIGVILVAVGGLMVATA